jgi:hypothetical protein
MRIIAFIDVSEAIEKILKHIGLWDVKRKPAARANAPPIEAVTIYDDCPAPRTPCSDDYIIPLEAGLSS